MTNTKSDHARALRPTPVHALFCNIPFKPRARSNSPYPGLSLGGHWVEQGYFELAWRLVCAHFSRVDWSRKQTAESLCNDPDWKDRRRGDRLKLGRCIKYFADNGMLPIWVCNPGKSGKLKYHLLTT